MYLLPLFIPYFKCEFILKIIGISAYYHDSAVTFIENGEIISAAQEERFTRKKHDAGFPSNALKFCLTNSKYDVDDIDFFCFYEKPFLKFERLLETYLSFSPKGFKSFKMAIPIWIKEKLFQKSLLAKELLKLDPEKNIKNKILFSEHHLSHAASAFYPSPFDDAAILTLDGVGEWATTTMGIGNQNNIDIIKEIRFPHSLGLLYSAFTYYTGFKVNSGEYKLMGLAPYGTAKYSNKILNELVDVKSDGSFRLNQDYFDYCTGLRMVNKNFEKLFNMPSREPEKKILKFHMDIAASIQKVSEYIVLKICRNIKKETKKKYLCMAGGVALNCVINGKIIKEGIFDDVWVQPAAGDAGGSLGAALLTHYKKKSLISKKRLFIDRMKGSLLGPEFSNNHIEKDLRRIGARFIKLDNTKLIRETVNALTSQKIVGWFQGRMEFGPRALGNRSILADPRHPDMQKKINLKIKFRESFRPFAPSILLEKVEDWFDCSHNSPYMLLVYGIKKNKLVQINKKKLSTGSLKDLYFKRSLIPAVTHVDNSARVQTVDRKTNFLYHNLINQFYKMTGCPILINTSFNIRNEPIVCTANDAFKCLMGTDMDLLVIGNYLIYKERQDPKLLKDYRKNFKLD